VFLLSTKHNNGGMWAGFLNSALDCIQHAATIVGHFTADCILYEYGKIARITIFDGFFNLKIGFTMLKI
jgi:hypothetical protein